MKPVLKLLDLHKEYDDFPAVRGITLEVQSGEFFTFLGPSGCGKTTTLRMIAGFEEPTGGRIVLDGKDITDLPPFERDVNTVFQNYALFPHMTVQQNIEFGLQMRKTSREETLARVQKMISLFGLAGLEKRKPAQLSGGQQQRVAVARALVLNPKVLLLDEPLAALDAKLRRQIQIELKELQKSSGVTFVYVTHDQEEALSLSDRIAVMRDGVLEQVGTPRDIYDNPKTSFVAGFVGENNLLPATLVNVPAGKTVAIRPEKIHLNGKFPADGKNALGGVVKEYLYGGTSVKVVVSLDCGKQLLVQVPAGTAVSVGERVVASWSPGDICVLPDEPYREVAN